MNKFAQKGTVTALTAKSEDNSSPPTKPLMSESSMGTPAGNALRKLSSYTL
jgi:hypothetical protein